jgi:hypothetical protein
MTRRTDRIIELLAAEVAQGRSLPPEVVAATLRSHGLRPSEAGWVLHHVFGTSMPEAVHIATMAVEADDVRSGVAPDEWPASHAGA